MIKALLKKMISNDIVKYLFTRYLTYFLQFFSSFIIAAKLEPFYFGVWGFILLIINYYRIVDFGISNSTSVLMIQNKDNQEISSKISSSSVFLVSMLGLGITIFTLYYYLFGIPIFDKYQIGEYFFVISIIGIIANFNVLFMNIYRIKNSIKEIVIYQSVIPYLVVIVALFLSKQDLLYALVGSYLAGNIISLIIFLKNKKIPKWTKVEKPFVRILLNKAFYLFIYNVCFYLIIVSIKTLISVFYKVEEFGLFSFAYSLSNSILLFLQAVTFLIFPKIIHKLKGDNYSEIDKLIQELRTSYVTLSFGLVFLGIILFPILLYFIPKYQTSYLAICFCSLAVVLYTNSFGYGSFLMAQNKERLLAVLAISSLIFNVLIGLALIHIFDVRYEFVILATVCSYTLYTFLVTYFALNNMHKKNSLWQSFKKTFSLGLFIPYGLNLILVIFNLTYLLWIPLLLFIFLNFKAFKEITLKIKTLLNNPKSINL